MKRLFWLLIFWVGAYAYAAAQFPDHTNYIVSSGGSANAQTLVVPNYVGPVVRGLMTFTNTGPMTLSVNGTGVIAVKKPSLSGPVALVGGEVVAGQISEFIYDGTQYEVLGSIGGSLPIITKNIKTDYGATGDGVHSDQQAFLNFSAANAGLPNPVVLTVPAGTYCFNNNAFSPYYPFRGVLNLTVNGAGAGSTTITDTCSATTGGYIFGSKGTPNTNTESAPVQSVAAGSRCVFLANLSDVSKYTIGNWSAMTDIDLQGFGYPANPGAFEYLQIASIDAKAGAICFTAPLQNSYLSTYPAYLPGSGFQINLGGPAFLYQMETQWGATHVYSGLTLSTAANQIYCPLYSCTFKNVTVTNAAGIVSTQNYSWTADTVTCTTCQIETDKMVETATWNNSTLTNFTIQSASIHNLNLLGTTVSSYIHGTPLNMVCDNSSIAILEPGALAYGASNSFTGNVCNIGSIITGGGANDLLSLYSYNGNGNFSFTNTGSPVRWAVPPNGRAFFVGQFAYEGFPFTVKGLSLVINGSNYITNVRTSLTGGALPTLPGTLSLQTDPLPVWNCSLCTGSPQAIDLSQAAAQGAPIFTYTSRTYTCAANIANVPGSYDINSPPTDLANIWGAPVSITANVSVADTSATTPLPWHALGQFGIGYTNTSGAAAQLDEIISLKTAGVRTMTPTTTAGAQTGDTLVNLSAVAALGATVAPFNPGALNVAGTCPVVTLTLQTTR